MNSKYLVFLCFVFLFFSSCEEDVINNSRDDYAKLVEEVKNESEISFQNEMHNYFGNNEYVFSSNLSNQSFVERKHSQNSNKIQQVTGVVGPISTNLPQYGSIKNQKLYLSNQPGLATGIYFCDIYSYYKQITLPTNALVGYANTLTPQGFSNYTTQTVGYSSSTSSSNGSNSVVLSVLTYKIHVRYTVTGSSIDKVLPSNLNNINNLTLTYSYVTP